MRLAGDLEGTIVDLTQSTLIHIARLMQTVKLQIIAAEVFHARAHAARLHALNICLCKRSGKTGILREILKIAPVQGIALDIHAGPEQKIDPSLCGILTQTFTHQTSAVFAPSVGKDLYGRVCNGGIGIPHAVLSFVHCAQSHRTVRHEDCRQLPSEVLRVPRTLAADQT